MMDIAPSFESSTFNFKAHKFDEIDYDYDYSEPEVTSATSTTTTTTTTTKEEEVVKGNCIRSIKSQFVF